MKNPLNPRSGFCRGFPSSETPHHKLQKSARKRKPGLENAPPPDPNVPSDSPIPMTSPAPKSTYTTKARCLLPPRPPRKRKFTAETSLASEATGVPPDSGVQVIIRIRPTNNEDEEGKQIVEKIFENSISISDQVFTFDSVVSPDSTQQHIFELVGIPLVENCLAGFNSSIFAYGQTGSGKTYTMWGPLNALLEESLSGGDQMGLTPRVFERLFTRIEEEQVKQAEKQLHYQCRCSILEIYNEHITDLLDPNQRNLQIREDVKSGVYVENLTEEYVSNMKDVNQLLIKGLASRRTGATSLNSESSRSHCVFTCVVESRCKSIADGHSSLRTSRINLVDLAGSERQKQTRAAGLRLKEASNINRSLSQLGNLINILSEISQSGKQRHIPYRDSKLTFLLQESLGGNAKLAMICAVSPAQSCKNETFSTLRFAHRAKAITNKAIVNEVRQDDVNVLREVIRQLKDELVRIKSNGSSTDSNGGHSKGWNARRSLRLLKFSLNYPMTLPHVDDDSDEEMEIDEEDIQSGHTEVGLCSVSCEEVDTSKTKESNTCTELVSDELKQVELSGSAVSDLNLKEVDANRVMIPLDQCHKHGIDDVSGHANGCESGENEKLFGHRGAKLSSGDMTGEATEDGMRMVPPECKISNSVLVDESVRKSFTCLGSQSGKVDSSDIAVDNPPQISPCNSLNSTPPPVNGVVSCQLSAEQQSPPLISLLSVDNGSRKSLRTLTKLTASQKEPSDSDNSCSEMVKLSLSQLLRVNSYNVTCDQMVTDSFLPTENLEASLQRGLEVLDSHRQNSPQRRSSFRFSLKPVDLKPLLPVDKIDVGVQTICQEPEAQEDASSYKCNYCKAKNRLQEIQDDAGTELALVKADESQTADKSKKKVPKAVEKVLAGAIRREMELEEFCARQAAEIMQLNRLVQQYKHERECNAIIEQTREDKICRLEYLVEGVLPEEEFMEEEYVALANEYKLLKEKYDNHPEVLSTKLELKKVHDELDAYRSFFDMGERDVLVEEIQHLRNQLQYYMDFSPISTRIRSSLLKLTYPPKTAESPLSIVPEQTEENCEKRFELERGRWIETERKWMSLCEELGHELEQVRSLSEKQKHELKSEKKCSEELKEALQTAMQGHARILDQYAELQEKHMTLLSRHQKMRDGIEDVKRAAAKAGVKGAESKFINALAAEISALKVEREKEKRDLRDENKGLQSQLRDTAEAVLAAGELLVRLKEAEETAVVAQKRAVMAEQIAEKAQLELDELKKKHEREVTLNELLAESRLPKEICGPSYCNSGENDQQWRGDFKTPCNKDDNRENVQQWREDFRALCNRDDNRETFGPSYINSGENDLQWRKDFDTLCNRDDNEFSRISEPSSWFSGYDRCNI